MDVKYLNNFNIISYNLHNGNVTFKSLKKLNDQLIKVSKNEDDNNFLLNASKSSYNTIPIKKEYWVIKNKKNEFKILIKTENIEIETLMYVKAGPFFTLEEAKNALNIITNWRYSDVI